MLLRDPKSLASGTHVTLSGLGLRQFIISQDVMIFQGCQTRNPDRVGHPVRVQMTFTIQKKRFNLQTNLYIGSLRNDKQENFED